VGIQYHGQKIIIATKGILTFGQSTDVRLCEAACSCLQSQCGTRIPTSVFSPRDADRHHRLARTAHRCHLSRQRWSLSPTTRFVVSNVSDVTPVASCSCVFTVVRTLLRWARWCFASSRVRPDLSRSLSRSRAVFCSTFKLERERGTRIAPMPPRTGARPRARATALGRSTTLGRGSRTA